jgi:hypothetical protein
MKRQAPSKNGPGIATAAATGTPASGRSEPKPTDDQIRRRAYEIYLRRVAGGKPGDPKSDWVQAERELSRR